MANQNKIKVENFKVGRDTSSQINSALIILIVGMIITSLPVVRIVQIYNSQGGSLYPFFLGEVTQLLFLLVSTILSFQSTFITSAVTGWAIGGFLAAILYGDEGKNGPLYASYILARIIAGLLVLIIPMAFLLLPNNPTVFGVALLPVIFFVLSLPLILVASISYRIGLWLSPSI